jgi:hypothetical protein
MLTFLPNRGYTRASVDPTNPNSLPKIDVNDSHYVEYIWFYIFCGLLDSMWQTCAPSVRVFRRSKRLNFAQLLTG